MNQLCDDLLWYTLRFLSPIDILNFNRVFSVLSNVTELSAVCELETIEWYYKHPPDTLHYRATRVVEIASLEPHYSYKSFACTPYTVRDDRALTRKYCDVDVIHIHKTWITRRTSKHQVDTRIITGTV